MTSRANSTSASTASHASSRAALVRGNLSNGSSRRRKPPSSRRARRARSGRAQPPPRRSAQAERPPLPASRRTTRRAAAAARTRALQRATALPARARRAAHAASTTARAPWQQARRSRVHARRPRRPPAVWQRLDQRSGYAADHSPTRRRASRSSISPAAFLSNVLVGLVVADRPRQPLRERQRLGRA